MLSVGGYFLFSLISFIIAASVLIGFYFCKEHSEIMSFNIYDENVGFRQCSYIVTFLIIILSVAWYFISPNGSKLNSVENLAFVVSALLLMLMGLIPCGKKCSKIIVPILEFGIFFIGIYCYIVPERDLTFKLISVFSSFALYKFMGIYEKYSVVIYSQGLSIALPLFVAALLPEISSPIMPFVQLGGLIFVVCSAILPFSVYYHVELSLEKPLVNLINGMIVLIALFVAKINSSTSAVLLISYPVFEILFLICLLLHKLFHFDFKQKTYLLLDILGSYGASDAQKAIFVFKRSVLFSSLFLFSIWNKEFQPMLRGLYFVIVVRFCYRFLNPEAAQASFRSLFRQMKNDLKTGLNETNAAYERLKEKHFNKKEENLENKELKDDENDA